MENKGFTLTELLGVIVIIALLLLLIIPGIINRLSDSGDDATDAENQLIFDAADQYIREHPEDYPPGKSGRYCITIQSLIDDGKLASPVKDVTTGEDISDKSVMVTIYSSGTSDYELRDGNECDELASLPIIDFIVEPSGSSWVKQRKVTIIYPSMDGDFEASHRIDGGSWTRDNSADDGGNIELTFTKIGQLEARLKGSNVITSKINLINIDSEKPIVREIATPSEWSNKPKTATATVYDGISGVAAYYLSKSDTVPDENDSGWITVNYEKGEKTIEITNLDEGTYYLWVKDKAGNISDSSDDSKFVIDKIDTIPPTCNITVGSGTVGNNDWYTSNVKLDLNYDDDESGVLDYGILSSSEETYNGQNTATQTADTKGITYYGYVKDAAGNTGNCSIDFKKDSTKPTLSYTLKLPNGSNYTQNTWSRSKVTRVLTPNDATSGVAKVQYKSGSTWNDEGNVASYVYNNVNKTDSFRVVDNAGNISTETSLKLKVDTVKPSTPYCKRVYSIKGLTLRSSNCNGARNCATTFKATGSAWSFERDLVMSDNLSGIKSRYEYWKASKYGGTSRSPICNWITNCKGEWHYYYADLPVTFDNNFRVDDNAGNVSSDASCDVTFAK